jgi:hypothetical protein
MPIYTTETTRKTGNPASVRHVVFAASEEEAIRKTRYPNSTTHVLEVTPDPLEAA